MELQKLGLGSQTRELKPKLGESGKARILPSGDVVVVERTKTYDLDRISSFCVEALKTELSLCTLGELYRSLVRTDESLEIANLRLVSENTEQVASSPVTECAPAMR